LLHALVQQGGLGSPPGGGPPLTAAGLMGPTPDTLVFGPFLRFGGYDPTSSVYTASVLVVVHQTKSPADPTLVFKDVNVPK
jgi:hypothetical protein